MTAWVYHPPRGGFKCSCAGPGSARQQQDLPLARPRLHELVGPGRLGEGEARAHPDRQGPVVDEPHQPRGHRAEEVLPGGHGRQVKAGHTIVITEHGRTVGRIVPTETSLDEKLAALQQAGLIRWNGKKLKPMQPIATLPEGCSLSDLIIEDRR